MSTSVQVPIARPAAYAPAWDEKAPGVRVSRVLDLADLLAHRRLGLANASVSIEPPLQADSFFVSDVAIRFFVNDTPPSTIRGRCRVMFDLTFSDGSADRIVVFQPIAAPAPSGLVAADVDDALLSIGGDVVTVGGQAIFAGPVQPGAPS